MVRESRPWCAGIRFAAMCGRFTLATPADEWARLFEVEPLDTEPRYNIAPTQPIVALRAAGAGGREAVWLRWGFVPRWTEPNAEPPLMINARIETLCTRPSFRDSARDRRCAVVADGFYEWMPGPGGKRPFWIHRPAGDPFLMAGVWDAWRSGGEAANELLSCAIVTRPASADLEDIHDRMPACLEGDLLERWLDPSEDADRVRDALESRSPAAWRRREVSTLVNSVANDARECLSRAGTQAELFPS